jgi:hypothetical protein
MTLYYYIVSPDKGEELLPKTGIQNPSAVPLGENVIITSAVQFEGEQPYTNDQIKEMQSELNNGDT